MEGTKGATLSLARDASPHELTDKHLAALPTMLIEQLEHRGKHCKAQEQEKSDSPVLQMRKNHKNKKNFRTHLELSLIEPFLERKV
jgi:hypothetical protein